MLELVDRPASVMGLVGPVSIADLPPSFTAHWVARRKAELIAAIDGGIIDVAEACRRYRLSLEELAGWRRTLDRAGLPGLRATRIPRDRGR